MQEMRVSNHTDPFNETIELVEQYGIVDIACHPWWIYRSMGWNEDPSGGPLGPVWNQPIRENIMNQSNQIDGACMAFGGENPYAPEDPPQPNRNEYTLALVGEPDWCRAGGQFSADVNERFEEVYAYIEEAFKDTNKKLILEFTHCTYVLAYDGMAIEDGRYMGYDHDLDDYIHNHEDVEMEDWEDHHPWPFNPTTRENHENEEDRNGHDTTSGDYSYIESKIIIGGEPHPAFSGNIGVTAHKFHILPLFWDDGITEVDRLEFLHEAAYFGVVGVYYPTYPQLALASPVKLSGDEVPTAYTHELGHTFEAEHCYSRLIDRVTGQDDANSKYSSIMWNDDSSDDCPSDYSKDDFEYTINKFSKTSIEAIDAY